MNDDEKAMVDAMNTALMDAVTAEVRALGGEPRSRQIAAVVKVMAAAFVAQTLAMKAYVDEPEDA